MKRILLITLGIAVAMLLSTSFVFAQEKVGMNILELLDWKFLLITAVFTAFITSAVYTVIPLNENGKPKVHINITVAIVAFIVTALSVEFTGGSVFEWQSLALKLLSAMAFGVLFYNYIGQWFLDKLFEWIKKIFTDKFGGNPPTAPA